MRNRNARRYAEDYLSADKVLLCYERHIQKADADYELNDKFASLSPRFSVLNMICL